MENPAESMTSHSTNLSRISSLLYLVDHEIRCSLRLYSPLISKDVMRASRSFLPWFNWLPMA